MGTDGLPNIVVRHREPHTVDKTDVIDRYWKSKETGVTVQVTAYQKVQPEGTRRVVYLDPTVGVNISCTLQEFKEKFHPVGNVSAKF